MNGESSGEAPRCAWCHRPLPAQVGPGRPRRFCRRSCRQRDYEGRRRAAERGLDESEIIIARARLDVLHDRLYVLSCAVEDVDADLARATGAEDYRAAAEWLLEAARPLVGDDTV